MALLRQHKIIILSLVFYWPTIFILAHVPVPKLVRTAGVSDKGVHFLAYMILAFLLCSAINPEVLLDKKVNWRKAAVWWIILVVVLYGVLDEVLQSFVAERNCNVRDFIANLAGTFTGLIILTMFTFWPALLIMTGITIFGLSNISRSSLAELLPRTSTVLHLFAYALFTLLWIRYLQYSLSLKAPKLKWLLVAAILPAGLLFAVTLGSLILGKSFVVKDVVVSAVGIAIVIGTIYLTTLSRRRLSGGHPSNNR